MRLQIFLFYLALTSITSNSIVIACWVSKKEFLADMAKKTQVSTSTKRMQADLHKVFIALVSLL